ncbi:MAG: protein-glutamate O-methyltransferase CheR [Acidobacteriota bacterium]|nr:protein-glutamate O-methyltransferase CheR [Acidobacteriota bacterium]
MQISDREFKLFSDLIYKHFGIHLTEAKRSLLVRRLQNLLRTSGFKTFHDYYEYLMKHPSDSNFSELVNRITTNYTFFNREPDHFEYFSKVALPWMHDIHLARNSRDLRVWCAAASTGEEPYMLAMLMMEFFGGNYMLWDAGVLATDISEKALKTAVAGVYPADEFDRLPVHLRTKYFKETGNGEYEAAPRLKREVTYRRFNLINRTYPFKRPFDVIFCRNVMIYFDNPTKEHVLRQLHANLAPGGFLFIGHSESIMHRKSHWQYLKPAAYRKIG